MKMKSQRKARVKLLLVTAMSLLANSQTFSQDHETDLSQTFSQYQETDFSRIDSLAKFAPDTFITPESLTEYLVKDLDSELLKTRAIYSWILHHVSYDDKLEKKDSRNGWDISGERAFYKEKSICSGISSLFELMCDHAGLKSYFIYGYSNDESNEYRVDDFFIHPDHGWNVVSIDSSWYHIDITWDGLELIDNPDSIEFLITTEQLLDTRIPASPIFQFSSKPLSLEECINDSLRTLRLIEFEKYTTYDSLLQISSLGEVEEYLFLSYQYYAFNPLFMEDCGYALEAKADSIYYADTNNMHEYYYEIEKARKIYIEALKYMPLKKLLYDKNDGVYSVTSMVSKKEVKEVKKMISYIERKHL